MTHTRRKTRLDVFVVCLPLWTRLGLGNAPPPCDTFTSVGDQPVGALHWQ